MKPKKFQKKLTLNKKTIADLSNGQLGKIKGGALTLPTRCRCVDSVDVCWVPTEAPETCITCEYPCHVK
jgi:hypothetical protein